MRGEYWWADGGAGAVAVHPHMRGEYCVIMRTTHVYNGSPPHAWGIRVLMVTGTRTLRFTPTCVGNTCAYFVLVNNSTVHPHMRGEYGY